MFLLAAARVLGSDQYGSLAALLGLLSVVLIPAAALQMAVSREISRRVASGEQAGANAFATTTLRLAALATAPLVAIAFALAVPLAHLLHIHSTGVVFLTEATLSTALVFPVAIGCLQGFQRFHALAAMYAFPLLVRLVVFAGLAAAGYRLGGAIIATFVGAVAATALALALVRVPRRSKTAVPRAELRSFLTYLGPVAVGLVGIALVTHVDILIVKARFSGDDAGAYGAASAFARVAFFLPATILAVLFPRTAARQARGEETEDILGRSLLATAAFCGVLALFYTAAGEGLVSTTFGSGFAAGGRVLFSPANLAVHLPRRLSPLTRRDTLRVDRRGGGRSSGRGPRARPLELARVRLGERHRGSGVAAGTRAIRRVEHPRAASGMAELRPRHRHPRPEHRT